MLKCASNVASCVLTLGTLKAEMLDVGRKAAALAPISMNAPFSSTLQVMNRLGPADGQKSKLSRQDALICLQAIARNRLV